jgi:hypothetical protein
MPKDAPKPEDGRRIKAGKATIVRRGGKGVTENRTDQHISTIMNNE